MPVTLLRSEPGRNTPRGDRIKRFGRLGTLTARLRPTAPLRAAGSHRRSRRRRPRLPTVVRVHAVPATEQEHLAKEDQMDGSYGIYGADGRQSGSIYPGYGGSQRIYGADGRQTGSIYPGYGGSQRIYGADGRQTGSIYPGYGGSQRIY